MHGVVALVGFADATFLTVKHFTNTLPPCVFGSCELVLTSAYSTILGIPVALLGSIYYIVIAGLVVLYFDTRKEKYLRWSFVGTILGMLASLYFLFLQMFIIHAYCQYCLISLGTSTILFVLALIGFFKYGKNDTL